MSAALKPLPSLPVARQVVVPRRGGPDVLELRQFEPPPARAGEVQIRVRAAGVAFGDVFLREGLRPDAKLPSVPGYDVAGVVTGGDVGSAGVEVGTPVVAWTGGVGGYTDVINVPAWAVVPHPAALDPAVAGSLVLNYLTAYQLLHRFARVSAGDCVLVHGGAGGVGTAILQLGALAGARMYATASRAKHDLVRSLGAEPIDYGATDFVTEMRRLVPDGVDAVFDPIGGAHWERSFELVRPGGGIVLFGVSSATTGGRRSLIGALKATRRSPRASYFDLFRQSRTISGYMIGQVIRAHQDWFDHDLRQLIGLLERGEIEPVIDARLPLEEAAEAHRRLGERSHTGKIVLLME